MYTKIIFFIATLYVVNASVISHNAFDDTEAEIAELTSDLTDITAGRRCFPRLCDRLCRLLRFGNGTCVNSRCKCWNKAERSIADEILDDLVKESDLNVNVVEGELKLNENVEDSKAEIAELFLDPAELAEKRRCFNRLCNGLCRFKRFSNGTCVNSRCRCWNKGDRSFADEIIDDLVEESDLKVDEGEGAAFNNEVEESELNLNKNVKDTETKIADLSSDSIELAEKRRCFPRLCNGLCRLKRFGNGTCVNGQCRCWNKADGSFADEILDDLVEKSGLNVDEVEGKAFNNEVGQSDLDWNEEVEDTEIAELSSDLTDLAKRRRCFSRLCNLICRLKGFGNSTCVNGQCRCANKDNKVQIAELSADPINLFEIRRCSPLLCNRVCRLLRYGEGTCVRGQCKCGKIEYKH